MFRAERRVEISLAAGADRIEIEFCAGTYSLADCPNYATTRKGLKRDQQSLLVRPSRVPMALELQ